MSGKIVLPLKGDVVTTDDGAEFTVDDIARFKPAPAVYVKSDDQTVPVYFSDIAQLNGVMVEFSKSTNLFTTIGKLKRKAELPQPGQTVVTKDGDFEVNQVKYHNSTLGLSKGVCLINKEKQHITLNDVQDIKVPESETNTFKLDKFKKTFKDYFAK